MKKREVATFLSAAAVALTLLSPPQFAQTFTTDESSAGSVDIPSTMAPRETAQLMVPAQAALLQTLDAKKIQPGQQVRVTLSKSVQLKDGPELPRGTQLVGVVGTDPANPGDKSKVKIRFTEAEVKGGKNVAITATIVGIYAPASEDREGHTVIAGTQEPNTWTSRILEVDQIEPEAGIELKSKIAGENSGVLVSTKKNAVKIPAGSELALAIAIQKTS